jgi:cytochrome c oxidase subunit IV
MSSLYERIVPRRTYVLVCVALLVLTAATLALARVELGPFHTPVALAIAGAKAVLVGLFFMHLRYSPPLTRLTAVAALVWLGILIAGTMDDVLTRGWLPVPGK